MRTIASTINHDIFKGSFYKEGTLVDGFEKNPVFEELTADGSKDFLNYIKLLNLAKCRNLIVLSSSHHYYYDAEDMKEVKTLVNMKQLNQIKQIRNFLHSIFHLLPAKSYFIGCFFDYKNQNGFFSNSYKSQYQITGLFDRVKNGIESEIPIINMIYNIIDFRTTRYLTKRSVTLLLEEAGLIVLDITELNRLTYFCAQKKGLLKS
jgi:hypothetical protein